MKLKLDPTVFLILGALALGLTLPIRGDAAAAFDVVTKVGVFVLFFGYGARLSAAETRAGLTNWKLHLTILATTFVVFPLLALPMLAVPGLSEPIRIGLVFLCLVPSTVQMSITMTSLAGGNVPAAMVSATASNIAGVGITPLLAILFFPGADGGGIGFDQLVGVVVQLALPFLLGQLSRFATAGFMARHRSRLKYLDQVVIGLIVYGAFSDLRVSGVWRQLQPLDLVLVVPIVLGLMAAMFWLTWRAGGWLGFPREDRIALMFCGTKKSLATGVPMASVLFGGATVGVLVIPLMLYHQAQLLTGSVVATRMSRSASSD
jgi:sodium/bile acid cotransporter 7